MPRMKETNSKRRFQLDMGEKFIQYNRCLGLLGGIDGKGAKADKPLDSYIEWLNEKLDDMAKEKGQEPGTYVFVNSDERGLPDADGKIGKTGKEEIAAEYHSLSKFTADNIRIVNGKVLEGKMIDGRFHVRTTGNRFVRVPDNATVKPYVLPKMAGIESGGGRTSLFAGGLDVDENALNSLLSSEDIGTDTVDNLEDVLTPAE